MFQKFLEKSNSYYVSYKNIGNVAKTAYFITYKKSENKLLKAFNPKRKQHIEKKILMKIQGKEKEELIK